MKSMAAMVTLLIVVLANCCFISVRASTSSGFVQTTSSLSPTLKKEIGHVLATNESSSAFDKPISTSVALAGNDLQAEDVELQGKVTDLPPRGMNLGKEYCLANQYWDDDVFSCKNCTVCNPGTEHAMSHLPCGNGDGEEDVCRDCPKDHFQAESGFSGLRCQGCVTCDKFAKTLTTCQPLRNAICGPCPHGMFYFMTNVCVDCSPIDDDPNCASTKPPLPLTNTALSTVPSLPSEEEASKSSVPLDPDTERTHSSDEEVSSSSSSSQLISPSAGPPGRQGKPVLRVSIGLGIAISIIVVIAVSIYCLIFRRQESPGDQERCVRYSSVSSGSSVSTSIDDGKKPIVTQCTDGDRPTLTVTHEQERSPVVQLDPHQQPLLAHVSHQQPPPVQNVSHQQPPPVQTVSHQQPPPVQNVSHQQPPPVQNVSEQQPPQIQVSHHQPGIVHNQVIDGRQEAGAPDLAPHADIGFNPNDVIQASMDPDTEILSLPQPLMSNEEFWLLNSQENLNQASMGPPAMREEERVAEESSPNSPKINDTFHCDDNGSLCSPHKTLHSNDGLAK